MNAQFSISSFIQKAPFYPFTKHCVVLLFLFVTSFIGNYASATSRTTAIVFVPNSKDQSTINRLNNVLRVGFRIANSTTILPIEQQQKKLLLFSKKLNKCYRLACHHKLRKHLKVKRLLLGKLTRVKQSTRFRLRLTWIQKGKSKESTFWFRQAHYESNKFFVLRASFSLFENKEIWTARNKLTKGCKEMRLDLRKQYKAFLKKHSIAPKSISPTKLYDFVLNWIKQQTSDSTIIELRLFTRLLLTDFPTNPNNPNLHFILSTRLDHAKKKKDAQYERDALQTLFNADHEWFKTNHQSKVFKKFQEKYTQSLLQSIAFFTKRYQHYLALANKSKRKQIKTYRKKRGIDACKKVRVLGEHALKTPLSDHLKRQIHWDIAQSFLAHHQYTQALSHYRRVRVRSNHLSCKSSQKMLGIYIQLQRQFCKRSPKKCPIFKSKREKLLSLSTKHFTIPKKQKIDERQNKILDEHRFLAFECPTDTREKRLTHLYRMISIYSSFGHLSEARILSWIYLSSVPSKKASKRSMRMHLSVSKWFHLSAQTNNNINEKHFLNESIQSIQLRHSQHAPQVKKLLVLANSFEHLGMKNVAAFQYEYLAKAFLKNDRPPQYLWRSLKLYEMQKNNGKMIEISNYFLTNYPEWKQIDMVLFSMAELYKTQAMYDQAIAIYRRLSTEKRFRFSKKKKDATINCAKLLEHQKKFAKAADMYLRYAKLVRQLPEETIPQFQYALMHSRLSKWNESISLFASFIERFSSSNPEAKRTIMAHGEIAKALHEQFSSTKKSRPWRYRKTLREQYRRILQAFKDRKHLLTKGEINQISPYIILATYGLMEFKYNHKFSNKDVASSDLKAQRRELSVIIQLYENMKQSFSDVRHYSPTPSYLCGLHLLAKGKMHIIQSIRKMPLPRIKGKKWNQTSIALYKKEIQKKYIQPLQQQAINTLKQLFAISTQHNLSSPCLHEAKANFLTLKPSQNVLFSSKKTTDMHSNRSTKNDNAHQISPPRPLSHTQQQCYKGQREQCKTLAHNFAQQKNLKKALFYRKIACFMGEKEICHQLSLDQLKIPREEQLIFAQKACMFKSLSSCRNLTKHYSSSRFFWWMFTQKKCQMNDSNACQQLSTFHTKLLGKTQPHVPLLK